jgi:hypothetical protein
MTKERCVYNRHERSWVGDREEVGDEGDIEAVITTYGLNSV